MNQDIFVLIEHFRGQVADISYVMLAAANQVKKASGGAVVAVLLGKDSKSLMQDLAADRAIYVDHAALKDFTPEAYLRVCMALIQEYQPRLMLFGDTTIGADIAGALSARLNLPLVSSCQNILAEAEKLIYVSQICGGKILAQGELPAPAALVTMLPGGVKGENGHGSGPAEVMTREAPSLDGLPVRLKGYIEPETADVDITRENILVSVGRGIQNQDNIDMVKELADALGGVVSASRPVVDQGWLPTTRLVGKSGRRVKPTVYLALGISGAPEHAEAITDSQVIIAINTDPAAPIFNIAKYGAVVDLLDLVPVLTEKVSQAK